MIQVSEQNARVAGQGLRLNARNALRVADFLDPAGKTHHLVEVTDMGQFAKDWDSLKAIIEAKDDAIDQQGQQITALQAQVTSVQSQLTSVQQQLTAAQAQVATLTAEVPDAADLAAMQEVDQVVAENAPANTGATATTAQTTVQPAPAAPAAAPAASATAAPAGVTVFTK